MEKSPKKIYGIVGFPVKHSLSPFMHNAAFQKLGLNAEYQIFELKENELENFVKVRLKKENIWGFNVTIPYKEKFMKYIDGGFSSGAEAIGAVNTVRRAQDGKLAGFNTDWSGFSRDLLEQGFNVEGKRVCVLGAGGAARAIVFALREAEEIIIYDVDNSKAKRLVEDMYLDEEFETKLTALDSIIQLPVEESDLLVNATPVGMKKEDPLLIPVDRLHEKLFVYDIIYRPQETKLLNAAKAKSLKYSNGLGMLLYQGVLAFQHWTGQAAPVEVMRPALLRNLE